MEVRRKSLVGVALRAAKLMIEMGNHDGKRGVRVAPRPRAEQRHTVRPAGDGRHDAAAAPLQPTAPFAVLVHQPRRNVCHGRPC